MSNTPKVIPIAEQETILQWYRNDKSILVYTCDTTFRDKMDKLCQESPDVYQCIERDKYGGCRYRMPLKMLTFRKKRHPGNSKNLTSFKKNETTEETI